MFLDEIKATRILKLSADHLEDYKIDQLPVETKLAVIVSIEGASIDTFFYNQALG